MLHHLSVLCTHSQWVAYMFLLLHNTSLKIYHFTVHGKIVTQYLQGAHHFSRQGTSFQCVTCMSMLLHRIGSIQYTLAVLSLSTDKVHLMIQSTSLQCRGFMFVLLHSTEVITYPSIYTGNISLPVLTGCSTTVWYTSSQSIAYRFCTVTQYFIEYLHITSVHHFSQH